MDLSKIMSKNDLKNLMNFKNTLEKESNNLEEKIIKINQAKITEGEIYQELLKQAETEDQEDAVQEDFFNAFSGPQLADKNKLVEVEYIGRIGYIDVSFESLDKDLTQQDYDFIRTNLEIMAQSTDRAQIKAASRAIRETGEKAVEVIFREARKFDLTNPEKRNDLVHLLGGLTVRSLKGRRILKGVLLKAHSLQHIKLAVMVAGFINDREDINELLIHAKSPELFEFCLEALLRIRAKQSLKPILEIIQELDVNRKDLIDQARSFARRIHEFGPECIADVYDAYISCQRYYIRPVIGLGLQSFKHDAVPFLLNILEEEKDLEKAARVARTIGNLRISSATKGLIEAYNKFPDKQLAIIEGLSHTRDKDVLHLILRELKENKNLKIKRICLRSLPFIGNPGVLSNVEPYTQNRSHELYLDALFCQVCFGDPRAFQQYVNLLVEGSAGEQHVLERFTSRLPDFVLKKIAEKVLEFPDNKALLILSVLNRPNVLPAEIGRVLKQKLESDPGAPIKMEIFTLIGKYVNTRNELLPQEVLYQARAAEIDPRIKSKLDQIIRSMQKTTGCVSTG